MVGQRNRLKGDLVGGHCVGQSDWATNTVRVESKPECTHQPRANINEVCIVVNEIGLERDIACDYIQNKISEKNNWTRESN